MRALKVNSRRFDMFCFHVSKSMSKVRSTHDSASTGSPSPAASVVELWAKSGTVPSPFDFQIVSATSAGTSAIPKRTACRQRRARTKATAGARRNSALAGFSARATPANVPARTASRCAPASSARTVSAAATRTATTDGKSACWVSPSAWGRIWSTQLSW